MKSDNPANSHSLSGRSKSIEDTEKVMRGALPTTTNEGEAKTYRVVYAVHELLPGPTTNKDLENLQERFIGLLTLRSLGPDNLALPAHMFSALSLTPECLTMELGYQFLPGAWGKGFATESINAVFEACKKEKHFWEPYERVFVRTIVNAENAASRRVMAKCGGKELGVHVWEGESLWLAGKWRTTDILHIFGKFVVE
jgi:RimJ/RimL family protein N-acetyltransferase